MLGEVNINTEFVVRRCNKPYKNAIKNCQYFNKANDRDSVTKSTTPHAIKVLDRSWDNYKRALKSTSSLLCSFLLPKIIRYYLGKIPQGISESTLWCIYSNVSTLGPLWRNKLNWSNCSCVNESQMDKWRGHGERTRWKKDGNVNSCWLNP